MLHGCTHKFLNDEQGGGTIMGLLWFMLLVGITGMAVDTGRRRHQPDQQQHVRALLRRRAEPANGGLLPAGPLIIGDCNTPDRGRVLMMMSLAPAGKGGSAVSEGFAPDRSKVRKGCISSYE